MTTLEMDPRIEARRTAVKRETGRRRMRLLVAAAVVVVAVVGSYLAIESPFLDVDHVRVTSTAHVSEAAVVRAAGAQLGRPLLRVDLAAIAARVDALPWVASAHVRRELPGTLRIDITEAKPVAYVRIHGQVAVLGAADRVIARTRRIPAGVIAITGVRELPALHELLSPTGTTRIITLMPPAMRAQVRAVALQPSTVAIEMATGEVRLGTTDNLRAKLAAANAVLAQYHGGAFEYIDVTVPADPVARP